jgi:hypothetical protein
MSLERTNRIATEDDWVEHKEVIRNLYLVQGRKLEDVRRTMRDKYQFKATHVSTIPIHRSLTRIQKVPMGTTFQRLEIREESKSKFLATHLSHRAKTEKRGQRIRSFHRWAIDPCQKTSERGSTLWECSSTIRPPRFAIRSYQLRRALIKYIVDSPFVPENTVVRTPQSTTQHIKSGTLPVIDFLKWILTDCK